MRKMNRIMICLVVGVLVLSVSAFAAFGSVGGYGQYKDAIKLLLLDTKNVSLDATATITLDGETFATYAVDGQYAGAQYRTHTKESSGDKTSEYWSSDVGGKYVSFNSSQPGYYHTWDTSYDVDTVDQNFLGFNADDEVGQRLVKFVELAADTVMGDLKNNFVQTDSKGGSKTYTVDISAKQVPALVNAGLSLMAGSMGYDNYDYTRVEYEDYQKTMTDYYEQATGGKLSPDLTVWLFGGEAATDSDLGSEDWYDNNQAALDKYYEVTDQFEQKFWTEADKHSGGVLYVHADGTTDYYATYEAYYQANPIQLTDTDEIDYLVGQDASLEHVTSTFTVDKDGRMTHNETTVTFTTTDAAGKAHELAVIIQADLWDYDTTAVQGWDPGDRTKLD